MIEFKRYTLPNGLRVIHNYDPSTVMVAVDIIYNTGSRDESRDLTGIAHLFEHLMFGGSVNIPDYDLELSAAGGTNNAWTSNDFTNFYDVVPAVNIETVFHLESDRMLSLSFNPHALEVQKNVVVEEFKQTHLNKPYGDLHHELLKALYSPKHPYSWPVIGLEPEHILKVTDSDVRQWFYSHYAPNNAVLAISGNIPYDKGRELSEKWFGDIPAREIQPRVLPDPGFPNEDKTITLRRNVPQPMIVIAIPMDRRGTHDFRVADCITDILSAGKSSRIYRNLIADGDGTFIDADASISGLEEPGYLIFTARVCDQTPETLEKARGLLLDELKRLTVPGDISAHEMERTFNRFESTFSLSNINALAKAQNLAKAEIQGEDINETVALQRTITTEDIARVAATLLNTPKVTLQYISI